LGRRTRGNDAALGHIGAQGRARGFWKIAKKYPKVEVVDTTAADWT
jgi:ribose transport system substrate-binding protein